MNRSTLLLLLVCIAFYAAFLHQTLEDLEYKQNGLDIAFPSYRVVEAPFPEISEAAGGSLRRYFPHREPPSMFAGGSQQGIAVVRSVSLSVTRRQEPTAEHEISITTTEGPECTLDLLTHTKQQLVILINATQDAEIVFESSDGADACTTTHVEIRVAIPLLQLDAFLGHVKRLGEVSRKAPVLLRNDSVADVLVLEERGEAWESGTNAAESTRDVVVALGAKRHRLERFRSLYEVAVNISEKATLLESILFYERDVMALERQLEQLEARHRELRAIAVIRLVDRDIRGWARMRQEQHKELEKRLSRSYLDTCLVVAIPPLVIGLLHIAGCRGLRSWSG
jgi:hypothetical protein